MKKDLTKSILLIEVIAFIIVIIMIWLDEIFDIPFFLGAVPTPVNWVESLFETIILIILAVSILWVTSIILNRVRILEGFLNICCNCKRIKDENGEWRQMEDYLSKHSEVVFSHGLCKECAKKLYPEIYK